MNYADSDLTFYLITYRDFARAIWCLDLVRIAYPAARIIVDVDGDPDPNWQRLETLHRAEVYYGERLFLLPRGGEIVSRMVRRHLTDPDNRRWLFRIDTDTEIRRQFRQLPDADYFGSYSEGLVQGGCIGMTRDALQKIENSRCLERPDLRIASTWQRGNPIIAEKRVRLGLLSFDWMVAWAMKEAGITGQPFKEIMSRWRDPVPAHVDVAVAHPCKHIPVNRPHI